MIETCTYTLEQLQARLAYWQRVLRLQDWDIDVRLVRMGEMGGDFAGEMRPFPLKKQANILILRHEDYLDSMSRGKVSQPHDMEYTLLHELMHLVIYQCTVKYDPGSREELLEEQSVHALALAFLSLTRVSATQLAQALGPPLPLDLLPSLPGPSFVT